MTKRSILSAVLALLLTCMAFVVFAQRAPAPQVPPPPEPLMAMANKIAEAINGQNADALNKMIAPDAVYLDEDGHAPAISRWVTALTAAGKKFTISNAHGQIMEGDNKAAWLSFNFVLNESTQATKGAAADLKGTATFVLKKSGNDWLIQMVHGSFHVKVAGLTGE